MIASPRRAVPWWRNLDQLIDPADMLLQGIYSVLIVVTFTLAAGIIVVGGYPAQGTTEAEPNRLWVEAFGAAVAWGLIDGVMYLLACRFERGQHRRLPAALRRLADEAQGIAVLADKLDEALEPLADRETREGVYRILYRRSQQTAPPPDGYTREDVLGALIVAAIGIGAASPLVLPLWVFAGDPERAVRLSNLIAFGLLFAMGFGWARYAGGRPFRTGLLLLLIGLGMVAIAIPLGG